MHRTSLIPLLIRTILVEPEEWRELKPGLGNVWQMRLDFPWCYLVHWAQDRKGWNRGSSLILRRIFVFSATWLVMSVQFYGAQDWRGGTKRHHIVLRLYLGEYLYSVLTTEYWWEILGATCLCKSLSRCFNNLWKFCSVGAVFTNSIYLLYTSTAEKISYTCCTQLLGLLILYENI